MLDGINTPVQKKNKDPSLPTNYSEVTVLSLIGKVLEKVLWRRRDTVLTQNQSKLQLGFPNKFVSINIALLISVIQNEEKDDPHSCDPGCG